MDNVTQNALTTNVSFVVGAKTEDVRSESQALTMGLVQMALEGTLSGDRDKIVQFIRDAKSKGCRVVVFPEGALFGYHWREESEAACIKYGAR